MSDSKIRVFRLRMEGQRVCIPLQDWEVVIDDIQAFVEQADLGDELHIDVAEVTQAELDAMPEFEGF